MLFSDDEINDLKYYNNIAIKINKYFIIYNDDSNFKEWFDDLIDGAEHFFKVLKSSIFFLSEVEVGGDEYEVVKALLSICSNRLESNIELIKGVELDYKGCVENFLIILSEFIEEFKKWQIGLAQVLNRKLPLVFDNLEFKSLALYLSHAVSVVKKLPLTLNDTMIERFAILESKFNDLSGLLKDINSFYESKSLEFLNKQRDELEGKVKATLGIFKSTILSVQGQYEFDVNTKFLKLKDDLGASEREMENIFGDLKLYKSIISENTENEISKHYSLKAEKEKRTYWTATSITASIIIASLGSAWFGLHDYYQNYVSFGSCYADSFYMDDNYKKCVEGLNQIRESTQKFALNYLVMRLIFSVLLFLTVIYTSRIAIRAYSHWRHSESMHLKLASLRPFINQLETKERDQIHKDLVPDYFGKDAGLVDSTNEKFKDLPANVSAVAMKAIEQISGSGSNSSTEKNNKKPESETG